MRQVVVPSLRPGLPDWSQEPHAGTQPRERPTDEDREAIELEGCPSSTRSAVPAGPQRRRCAMSRHSEDDQQQVDVTSTMMLGAIDDAVVEASEAGGGSDPEGTRIAESLPAGSALLVVRRGPNAGSRFLLD